MQSLGNDFVVIDQLKNPIKFNKNDIKKISNRNYGIGCDQVLVLEKSEKKEIAFKYKIYNKDGTESGQCGNGAKCIGKYYFDKYGNTIKEIKIETINRTMSLSILKNNLIQVDMGQPLFNFEEYKKKIFHTFSRIYDTQVGMAETDPFKVNVFKTATFFKKEDAPKKKKSGKIDFEEWNFDRIKKIIDTVPFEPYQLMFKLMAETSCRPSEARAAQRKNFHFKRNIPVFEVTNSVDYKKGLAPPKTEAGYRELEISTSLKDQLIDYMNTLPEDQQCIFLNSKDKFHDLSNMIDALDKAVESLNLKLPVARKTYFFRHWNVSYWCYQGKYTNPFDLATHMGDLDLKFINTNYIKKYSVSKESVKYSEHQNNNYNWN